MSAAEVGLMIEEARAEYAAAAPEFMPDACSVYGQTEAPDGYMGDTVTQTEIIANLPIMYKTLRFPMTQQIAGGVSVTLTHEVKMPATAATHAIVPDNELRVAARGLVPAFIFEHPVIQPDAMSPFLILYATRRIA